MVLRQENGFWVPADEVDRAVRRRFKADGQINTAVGFCKQKRVAIQAGGNWGYWPLFLSKIFGTVYTFEPASVPFCALAMNTVGAPNIIRLQAALGMNAGTVGIKQYPGASGHTHVEGEGAVPQMRIDDLDLDCCDLIYLDIEGFERLAIAGAQRTIMRHNPVIAFEDKGHSKRYDSGSVQGYLSGLGYREVAKSGYDVVMAC